MAPAHLAVVTSLTFLVQLPVAMETADSHYYRLLVRKLAKEGTKERQGVETPHHTITDVSRYVCTTLRVYRNYIIYLQGSGFNSPKSPWFEESYLFQNIDPINSIICAVSFRFTSLWLQEVPHGFRKYHIR